MVFFTITLALFRCYLYSRCRQLDCLFNYINMMPYKLHSDGYLYCLDNYDICC